MNKLPDYTAEQMHYIDSVDGNAHITAVAIIGVLESQINTIREKLTAETARADGLQKQVEQLTSALTAPNMSEIIINGKKYVRDRYYIEDKP